MNTARTAAALTITALTITALTAPAAAARPAPLRVVTITRPCAQEDSSGPLDLKPGCFFRDRHHKNDIVAWQHKWVVGEGLREKRFDYILVRRLPVAVNKTHPLTVVTDGRTATVWSGRVLVGRGTVRTGN